MAEAADRRVRTYSRGMKQRIKLAAMLVHDPELLILDEPLTGADPRHRVEFQELLHRLGHEGRTIVVSSHILEEVETLADRVLLVVNGKLAAEGDHHAIRAALDERPYHVQVVCSAPRELAAALVKLDDGRLGADRRRRGGRPAEPQRCGCPAVAARTGEQPVDQAPARRAARRLARERVRVPGGTVTAIYVLSVRQLAGKWRLLILLGLCAVPFAVAAAAGSAADRPTPSHIDDVLMNGLLASAILPIVALAVATAAFGNELSDKTLANLTLTPLAHWRIALPKLLAAITVSAPALVAGHVRERPARFRLIPLQGAGRAACGCGDRNGRRRRRSTRRSSSGPASSPRTRSRSGSSTSSSGRACSGRS